ncbi:hypothetical protein [Archangium lipolyticum]|uniref:hypothetical protein n=1 Tax=Archangium lipolyticum TaxID=2970465 RepID=UPI00214A44E6|nr:hypothetical protein [Archangium lipolyticum]
MDFTAVDPSMAGASGGHALVTTVFDLTTFWKKLRASALFERADTLTAMLSFESAPEPESRLVGYGLGVMRLESEGPSPSGTWAPRLATRASCSMCPQPTGTSRGIST